MSPQKKTISFILFPFISAALAGWFLASINIVFELLSRGSIYSLGDFYKIALWHILLWSCAGLIIGFVLLFFSRVLKRPRAIQFVSTSVLSLFTAAWIFVFGIVNIRLLSGFFSWQSLVWNTVILASGVVSILLLFRFLQNKKQRPGRSGLIALTAVLAALTVFSAFSSWSGQPRTGTQVLKQREAQAEQVNVLFILLDAVRADHLGCYGYPKETTPHIDRLAEQGVVFEKAFAQSSHTLESVPSYMTSTYPSTHTVQTQTSALPDRLITLPQFFKSAGYRTAVFSVNPYISPAYGYNRGVDDFYWLDSGSVKINKTILGYILQTVRRLPLFRPAADALLSLGMLFYPRENSLTSGDPAGLTDKAADWIRSHRQNPFFLYLHYDGGHNPYISPFTEMFAPGFSGPPVVDFPEGLGMFYPFTLGTPLSENQRLNLIAQYDGQVYYHDQCLGRLFELLSELGIKDSTLVVLTSDHGEEFFEHEGWGHGQSLFEETIHVPLILSGPGIIPERQRVPHLVELTDILPTLLDLCRIPALETIPYKIEGISLLSYLKQEETPPLRTAVFSELTQGGRSARCLRTKTHKAIEILAGKKSLRLAFNLETDPGEKEDISKEDDPLIQSLFSVLEKRAAEALNKAFRIKTTRLDKKQKEQLRSLGYLK